MSYQHAYMLYNDQDKPVGYHTSFKTLLDIIAHENPDKIVVLSLLSPTERAMCVRKSIVLFQPLEYDCVQVGSSMIKASKRNTMYVGEDGIPTWDLFIIDPKTEYMYDVTFHIKNTDEMYVGPDHKPFRIRQFDKIGDARCTK